jgi:hypothetical protein
MATPSSRVRLMPRSMSAFSWEPCSATSSLIRVVSASASVASWNNASARAVPVAPSIV